MGQKKLFKTKFDAQLHFKDKQNIYLEIETKTEELSVIDQKYYKAQNDLQKAIIQSESEQSESLRDTISDLQNTLIVLSKQQRECIQSISPSALNAYGIINSMDTGVLCYCDAPINDDFQELLNTIKNSNSLTSIFFDNCNLTDDHIVSLIPYLEFCRNTLQIVSLCNNNISLHGALHITKWLYSLPKYITTINLHNNPKIPAKVLQNIEEHLILLQETKYKCFKDGDVDTSNPILVKMWKAFVATCDNAREQLNLYLLKQ